MRRQRNLDPVLWENWKMTNLIGKEYLENLETRNF